MWCNVGSNPHSSSPYRSSPPRTLLGRPTLQNGMLFQRLEYRINRIYAEYKYIWHRDKPCFYWFERLFRFPSFTWPTSTPKQPGFWSETGKCFKWEKINKQCMLYTVYYILYIIHCILYTVYYAGDFLKKKTAKQLITDWVDQDQCWKVLWDKKFQTLCKFNS